MNFFRLHKPKGFQHTYLYYSERQERIKELNNKVKKHPQLQQKNVENYASKPVHNISFRPQYKKSIYSSLSSNISIFGIFILLLLCFSALFLYFFD